ncbi:LicD family protein [Oribacterium sp. WCC10]|uniref:LicD family protein n=1 Tax=Oribacterium sp. WCC10 TaxID=1855343 RepID=UPI0008E1054E|nr:LicD family protein [Oribacterium sp. WCC10]SFG34296.1 lipopolysaccharide cholinephosphotransferase [Oribacterium sp. WCC10]
MNNIENEQGWKFDLEKVHKANLEILRAIRDICEKHNITYLIDSGTLLGAVRHHGFIPWDDDIDICFRREEFERFKAIANLELPKNMELVMPYEYRNGEAFYDFVPRVLYLDSRRHSEDDKDMEFYEGKLNHLWVDLFIIDRLPAGKTKGKIVKLMQQILFGFGMAHRRKLDWSKYKGLVKFEVAVLVGIGKMIPMKTIFRWQDKIAGKYTELYGRNKEVTNGKSFFSNYQPDYQYCTVEDSWEEPIHFEFEGEKFTGPKEWDKVLKMLYGDYMKLPPVEKRVPSHSGRELEIL